MSYCGKVDGDIINVNLYLNPKIMVKKITSAKEVKISNKNPITNIKYKINYK